MRILLQSHKALLHELTEFVEAVAMIATKHFHLLLSQLEWSPFELDTFAGSIGEEETKVDVHYVAFHVQHNISIVSILDLQNITNQAISGKGRAEVGFGCFEGSRPLATELVVEEIDDSGYFTTKFLFDSADRLSIITNLNKTTSLASSKNFVWFEPEVEFLLLENLIKSRDELDGELFLPNIVIRFHNNSHELPGE